MNSFGMGYGKPIGKIEVGDLWRATTDYRRNVFSGYVNYLLVRIASRVVNNQQISPLSGLEAADIWQP
jgi:hypothetical protein